MSKTLTISLVIFSIIWFLIILRCVKKDRISIKYSLIWFLMALVLLLVGIIPNLIELASEFFGFLTISNMVIGIILSLLMFITLILTMIVTNQKMQIKNLIQEVSMLKKEFNDER